MGLKQMKLPTEVVAGTDGQLTVRGLSLTDVTTLVRSRGEACSRMFSLYSEQLALANNKAASSDLLIQASGLNMRELGISILNDAPDIAAMAIALADVDGEGSEEEAAIARSLPMPVQLDAIEKIGKLTFAGDVSPKKVVETVIGIMQGTTAALQEMRISRASSMASAAK